MARTLAMIAPIRCERYDANRLVWQAIVPAGGLSGRRRTDHSLSRRYFSGFVFAGIPQRSLRNSSRIGNGGLKGRLQATIACRTNGQSPVKGEALG
jgi:hypothetical protein